jgi:hypothetical protein
MRDGAGGNVVEGARQPNLPHRRGNVRQLRGDRRRRNTCFLAADLHGPPNFLKEGGGPIINNVRHIVERKENNQTEKERKMSNSKEKCEKEKQKSR